MKFSERWLRTFSDPDLTTQGLAHALTMAGLEVEEVTPAAPAFTGVVTSCIVCGITSQRPETESLLG